MLLAGGGRFRPRHAPAAASSPWPPSPPAAGTVPEDEPAAVAEPGDDRGAVAALAVDQDEGVVGGEVAQVRGPDDGRRVADRLDADVERGDAGPQLGVAVPERHQVLELGASATSRSTGWLGSGGGRRVRPGALTSATQGMQGRIRLPGAGLIFSSGNGRKWTEPSGKLLHDEVVPAQICRHRGVGLCGCEEAGNKGRDG